MATHRYYPPYARRASGRGLTCGDYRALDEEAMLIASDALPDLIPMSVIQGNDFVTLNPHRFDRHLGSFRLAVRGPSAGAWADFALKEPRARGFGVISWWAYYYDLSRPAAYRDLRATIDLLIEDTNRTEEALP